MKEVRETFMGHYRKKNIYKVRKQYKIIDKNNSFIKQELLFFKIHYKIHTKLNIIQQ
jgi:hypothetical protein